VEVTGIEEKEYDDDEAEEEEETKYTLCSISLPVIM
jgi:hypothetical protein